MKEALDVDCESWRRHARVGLRYPGDLTAAERALIALLIPPARRGGRPRSAELRAVVEGLLYLLVTGCQWPPSSGRSRRCDTADRLTARAPLA
jgi:hypothetical protein